MAPHCLWQSQLEEKLLNAPLVDISVHSTGAGKRIYTKNQL